MFLVFYVRYVVAVRHQFRRRVTRYRNEMRCASTSESKPMPLSILEFSKQIRYVLYNYGYMEKRRRLGKQTGERQRRKAATEKNRYYLCSNLV